MVIRPACRLGIAAFLALAAANVFAQEAPFDMSGFWAVKFESKPSGQFMIDALPDSVVLLNDTGGGELGEGDFGGLKLSETARAEVENYDFAAELDPQNACIRPSVALYMQAPFPMEIYQGRDLIVFKMEYFDMYRVIFLDGREHPPADAPHSKSGHSVGHWDGNSLVVDTTHIASGSFLNNGFNHSDDLHIVERFAMSPDGKTLWLTQTYEDPSVFEGTAARYMAWTLRPGDYVYPYDCDPGYGR